MFGLLVGLEDFQILHLPLINERLKINCHIKHEVGTLLIVESNVFTETQSIAKGTVKIFLSD